MIRDILFPNLPSGHFLVAKRAVVELAFPGSRKRLPTHEESPANKVATLHLTLPVRFRGGTLVVRHPEDVLGIEEKFAGRGGKGPTLEWVAFLADCSTALEPVEKGCKMTMIYNIVLQSNAQGGMPNPVAPVLANHRFLDAMTPLFTKAKHRKLGFYLSGEYHLNPVDSIAGTLIGQVCIMAARSIVRSSTSFLSWKGAILFFIMPQDYITSKSSFDMLAGDMSGQQIVLSS
jgi:hypothetical protein